MRPGGAPYNNVNARGVFIGIGVNHKREHLFRAVLEGVCMNIRVLLDRFEKFRGRDLSSITIIGGGSRNPFWMKLLADITLREIVTINLKQEANCFAAAQCAGVGVGLYKDFKEIKKLFRTESAYVPDKSVADFYARKHEAFLSSYRGAVKTYDILADLELYAPK
jgi:xylulokinase